MNFRFALSLAGALLLATAAQAQETVTLVAPTGARAAIEAIIPDFEKATGYKVKATFGSGLGTKKQVVQGEMFDVPVVQFPFPEVLSSGNVVVKSQMPLGTVAVAVAVKAGAPKPDISNAAAVKKMLLAAKSVSYPDPAGGAAAGVSFDKTLEQLGITAQMKSTLRPSKGGFAAMKALADGEVEIGLTFRSEMQQTGIDILGPLPKDISAPTQLVGFVSSHSKDPKAAAALLAYLARPESAKFYRDGGMVAAHH